MSPQLPPGGGKSAPNGNDLEGELLDRNECDEFASAPANYVAQWDVQSQQ